MQLEETIPNIKQGFWIFTLMWLLQNSTAYKFAYTFSPHITSPKINQLSPSTCLTQKWWWWWWGVLGMVHTCARERSQRYAQAQLWWHSQQINELFCKNFLRPSWPAQNPSWLLQSIVSEYLGWNIDQNITDQEPNACRVQTKPYHLLHFIFIKIQKEGSFENTVAGKHKCEQQTKWFLRTLCNCLLKRSFLL